MYHFLTEMYSLEIVRVQRPYHCSAEIIARDKFGLKSNHVLVVERYPLVATVGVRAHGAQGVLDQLPIAFQYFVADLKTQRTRENQNPPSGHHIIIRALTS